MTLPPLPEPFFGMTGFVRLNAPYSPAFSTYQMTEYGKLCRETALNEAAEVVERCMDGDPPSTYSSVLRATAKTLQIAAIAIRRLK